jgi:malonate-semialdehyde dehydrogenase (acetylating)/methylmalonate-semialdehyde dehydrogenase
MKILKNYINGKWIASKGQPMYHVVNSATTDILAKVPESTPDEIQSAIEASKKAFLKWKNIPPHRRGQLMTEIRNILYAHKEEIGKIVSEEHGKTLKDANGELGRAFEYVVHTCGIAELMKGQYSENVGSGVDTFYIREPLGTFAIIPPFNFPAMISLYFCWAIACGNSVIIKPSEICPMTITRIIELIENVDIPPGVINLVHGGGETGNKIITHPDIAGVSFVGSSKIAKIVYDTASVHGKRAQCQGGAKNHIYIHKEAMLDAIVPNVVSSCFGHTSQRCFAASNILVDKEIYDKFLNMFIEQSKSLKVGNGLDPEVDMGPVVNVRAYENLLKWIDTGINEGAKLLLDGRNIKVENYPNGYFLGATVFEAEPEMKIFKEEIFGPVRCIKKVKNFFEALEIINSSQYGHTSAIYTENGGAAREFVRRADTGQVGINVGTPAPIAFYPVGGRKISFYGSLRGRANDAIDFYTDKKLIVSTWHSIKVTDGYRF